MYRNGMHQLRRDQVGDVVIRTDKAPTDRRHDPAHPYQTACFRGKGPEILETYADKQAAVDGHARHLTALTKPRVS